VPRLVFAPHALDDLDRLTDFLLEQSPESAAATAPIIISGLQALKLHPLLGRPAEYRLRELLISRGRTGYVALYDYHAATDTVLVLAVRHQREAGFRDL
jgi:plasmid stabilization system protein ParE